MDHNPPRNRSTKIDFAGTRSATEQQHRDATRVDSVLKKYATTGVETRNIQVFQQHQARMTFGLSDTNLDYQRQLNMVISVREYFEGLPSMIRAGFNNDPAQMIEFMADPKNREECYKLNLLDNPAAKQQAKETDSSAEPATKQAASDKTAKKPQKQKPAAKDAVESEQDAE